MRLEYGNFDKFFYIFSEFLLKNAKNQQKSLFSVDVNIVFKNITKKIFPKTFDL